MPSSRTAFAPAPRELEKSNARLLESEQRRSLAIAAGKMGSWDWDWINGDWMWDEGQFRIFGVDPKTFEVDAGQCPGPAASRRHRRIAQGDRPVRQGRHDPTKRNFASSGRTAKFAGASARRRRRIDKTGRVVRVSGVTVDITERKRAEERQNLLTREVDHRAKNALALAQSIVRLTRGESVKAYMQAVEGRISALARVHTILSLSSWQGAEISKLVDEELAPYSTGDQIACLAARTSNCSPRPRKRWRMALHELVTNSAKYGALSTLSGRLPSTGKSRRTFSRWSGRRRDGPLVESRHRAASEPEA